MPSHRPLAIGQDVFWEVSVLGYSGIMSWNPVDGKRPLLRWEHDWTRGAGNFGTDGKVMVWSYGEGKPPTRDYLYPKLSLMTAPYTTDPQQAQATARRVRDDWCGTMSATPYAVGHGYASRRLNCAPEVVVVRIADGMSWRIHDEEGTIQTGRFLIEPLGITPEYLYAWGVTGTQSYNIVRIALDSLGPGELPE